jgi:hypothetical protein
MKIEVICAWKDGRVEEDLLEALCSERCGGMLFLSFQPHRDHRALRASFSL